MPIEMGGNINELKDRHRAIVTQQDMDPQELEERKEAAKAYALEDERHFVDYLNDCIKKSVDDKKEIRRAQEECWNVYNEKEPASYKNKAAWQSRIIVPRPFESVQFGASAIKKAFSPDYLSVQNAKDKTAAEFWRMVLNSQNSKTKGNFVLKFSDANLMALAIGESMEMIPRFVPGRGLVYDLVEPWKINRDPDASARDPQGGMYWIHQEWLDYFVLLEGEKIGKYENVARAKDTSATEPSNPMMTKEAIAARKKQIWQRSNFRTMILVSEFWGIVLDKKGELLLPSANFTVAGDRIIEAPKPVPYRSLRWPGISWSPLPNILAFGGRGLIEGVRSIWESMCNLMCLHDDGLRWVVDPPVEIEVDRLVDKDDVEDWPGKKYCVRESVQGHQAIRPTTRRDVSGSVMANMQYRDQLFQRGSFVTDAVQGLPGWRQDMTWRESAQNLDQGMSVFGLMGGNIELGAVHTLHASQEVIEAFAGYSDYVRMFDGDTLMLEQIGIRPSLRTDNTVEGLPSMSGEFSVSGIQALMKDAETLMNLRSVIIPLSEKARYAPYIKPYGVIKALESRINLTDEGVFVDADTAAEIEEKEKARMDAAEQDEKDARDMALYQAVMALTQRQQPQPGDQGDQ